MTVSSAVRALGRRVSQQAGGAGSLRRDVVFNAGGGGLLMLGQLVAIPLGIAVAGVPAYGAWVALFAVVQWCALLDLGLAAATLRRVADRSAPDGSPAVLGASLALMSSLALLVGAALGSAAGVVAGPLARAWGCTPSTAVLVVVCAAATAAFALIGRHFQAVNQGAHRYDAERSHQLVAAAARMALLGTGLVAGLGIGAVVVAELTALVLPGALSALRIRSTAPGVHWGRPQRAATGELLRFGLPWFLQATAVQAAVLLPPTAVGLTGGPVLAAATAAATRIAQAARQMIAWVLDPLVPTAAARPDAVRLVPPVTRAVARIALWLLVPAAALAFPAMRVWLGEGIAHDAAVLLIALIAALVVTVPHLAFGTVVLAHGRPAFYAPEIVVGALITLVALALAAPAGPVALAGAIVVPAVLLECSYLLRLRREVDATTAVALRAEVTRAGGLALPAAVAAIGVVLGAVALGQPAAVQLLIGGAVYVLVAAGLPALRVRGALLRRATTRW